MASKNATSAAPAAARKQKPSTKSPKLKLVTPETDSAAAAPKTPHSEPKPVDPNALRLTGKQMRSGMYALRCGDKYLPADRDHDNLVDNIADAHLDHNWSSLKSYGQSLSKILYPAVLPAPLTPVKLVFTTNGLVTTTKDYRNDPFEEVEHVTWVHSNLHNMALAHAADFEERHLDELIEHTFYLKGTAMWPLLMAQYEHELEAELAEDSPEAKWDAMRYLAARVFVAGMFHGVRAAQDKKEDEEAELRMKRARRKSDRMLRKESLKAHRRSLRDE